MTRDEQLDALWECIKRDGDESAAEALASLREELRRTAYERDSLRMERDGLEQVRLRDNQYLINQRDAALARAEQAERERDEARLVCEGAQENRRTVEARLRETAERNLALIARTERAEADNAACWEYITHVIKALERFGVSFHDLKRRLDPALVEALTKPHPGAALLEYVAALEVLRDACAAYFEHCAASHDDGCPEDDTCECPHVVRVNDAFRVVDALKERKS